MLDRDTRRTLEPSPSGDGDDESWLTSYLDVLTLLITLFVLLLALTPPGGGEASDSDRMRPPSAMPSMSLATMATGIQPRHDGLQPQFSGLTVPGVNVEQGREGITLRIDDSLLFASGAAQLTSQGRGVIDSLVEVLESFDGQISIEGHTDNIPISTVRFPSNWELSAARAIAVLRHLQDEGLNASRMRAVGYADTQPMESNDTPEGRAANRRVELLLRQPVGR
ncbi:OmpA family protein [Halomonas vilamensis]|uniref:OmpA family protein n=1 Tax=Vreelandella vilamensis TaxID=531309 RepID=A0ABU1H4X5_9GAMM|nr:OmpA family protein [Halomonas vilamensis]MDR5898707.1 OmpA family protein [Halomonas vilamensis]